MFIVVLSFKRLLIFFLNCYLNEVINRRKIWDLNCFSIYISVCNIFMLEISNCWYLMDFDFDFFE